MKEEDKFGPPKKVNGNGTNGNGHNGNGQNGNGQNGNGHSNGQNGAKNGSSGSSGKDHRPGIHGQRDLEDMMSRLEVTEMTEALMAEVSQPGNISMGTLNLRTNVFGIRLLEPDKPIYQYSVLIFAEMGKKIVEFTKKGKSDYMVTNRKHRCLDVFNVAIQKCSFYNPQETYFYDGQSMLYVGTQLRFPGDGKCEELLVTGVEVGKDLEFCPVIRFSISEVKQEGKSTHQPRLDDMRKIDRDVKKRNRMMIQFAEVATNMGPMSEKNRFVIFANGKIFPSRPDLENPPLTTVDVGEGKHILPGMTKSVRVVEGPKGRTNASPAVIIDSLKAAFHDKVKIIDRAQLILKKNTFTGQITANDADRLTVALRGLGCSTLHTATPRVLEIHGFSTDTALTKVIQIESFGTKRNMTVADYFLEKYKFTLKHPNAPLVMSRERGQINLYPMEALMALPMQRVTIPQTTSEQSRETTRACAVPPTVRLQEIERQGNMSGLFQKNKFLEAAGLEIVAKPMGVVGRALPPPMVLYNLKNPLQLDNRGKWNMPQRTPFLHPATIASWACYGVPGPRERFTQQHLRAFAEKFYNNLTAKGVKIPHPIECMFLNPEGKDTMQEVVRKRMRMAAEHSCQYVLFVTSDQHIFHKYVKLEERISSIITQDVKMKTAMDVVEKNKNQTMDNIVAKANVKNGGHNYTLTLDHVTKGYEMFGDDRMVVGISMSHPPPTGIKMTKEEEEDLKKAGGTIKPSPPAVVGVAVNSALRPTEFIGDVRYQDARRTDPYSNLDEVINMLVRRFCGGFQPDGQLGPMQARPPKKLIIYRQGPTEADYADIISREAPVIRQLMAGMGSPNCKLTYIVVSKEHNIRIMKGQINPNDKAPDQNIPVGTCVDTQIVHPNHKEFFINSHSTLQGSARTPRYTVVVDDCDYKLDELQLLTHGLCFGFQIINSPVSVPAPLYVANRYAQRGRDLYQAKSTDEMSSTTGNKNGAQNGNPPNGNGQANANGHGNGKGKGLEIPKLNASIAYYNSKLGNVRINA